jgi:hypothetical protein
MNRAKSSSLQPGWPLSASGSSLLGALNRFTPSQGFSAKIGTPSPGRISRVAQANMFETVPSQTFAMWTVARRAFMLAWIAARSISSMSAVPCGPSANFSNKVTLGRLVAGRAAWNSALCR